jgi:hypothetical protein
MGTATKHSPSPMEYDQAGEDHWRNGGVVPFYFRKLALLMEALRRELSPVAAGDRTSRQAP